MIRKQPETPSINAPRVLLTSMSGSYGGMEIRMQQDAELLNTNGWHPVISTPDFPERASWYHQLQASKIDVASLPHPYPLERWRTRHLQQLKARAITAPALVRSRFDLAHMFLCWTTYGLGMLWAIACAGIPAMVSVHNAFPMTHLSSWHRRHLPRVFETTRHIIAVSDSALDHFLRIFAAYLPAGVATGVVPNPIDTDRFKPRLAQRKPARQRLNIPSNALVLGSIGRLDKQKCPWKLIETLAQLHALGLPAYLVLVGQGSLEHSLREQSSRLGLDNHVIFTGYVSDVENLLPAFDIHLLLSRNEGFGIVTAESMAAGIPSFASNVPGSMDVLKGTKGGRLLASTDEASIAEELAVLLKEPEQLASMAATAPGEIKKRFCQHKINAITLETYRNALLIPRQCESATR